MKYHLFLLLQGLFYCLKAILEWSNCKKLFAIRIPFFNMPHVYKAAVSQDIRPTPSDETSKQWEPSEPEKIFL